jgi:gag-polypeptide of LTR copia-type
MEAILIKLGFWDLITGEEKLADGEEDKKKVKAFRKRQAECKSELVLRVEDSQLAHMYSSDPKAVWESLAAVHWARGFGSCLHIRQKFITAIMKEDQMMESWIGEVHNLSNRLKGIDITITDKDIIVVLMAGLPESYTPVIISFDSIDAKALTLEFVITHLLNEEGRQDKSAVTDIKKEETKNSAMRAKKSDLYCYYYLKKGHYSSVCPEKERDIKEKEDQGHKKLAKGIAAVAHEDSDGEDYAFLMDTGVAV